MANNVANALRPFELISKLCTLGHCEYSFGRLNVYFSNIYIITIWFIYYVIISYIEYYKIWISFDVMLGIVMYHCHLLTTAVSIICGMYYKQIYKQCIQQISMINDTLEALDISIEYKHLRKKVTHNVIRWILMSLILNVTQSTWYWEKTSGVKIFIAPFVVNHTINVNNLIDVIYETFIWYAGTIFEKINEYILHLSTSTNCGIDKMWTTAASRRFQRRSLIDTAKHEYSMLTIMHTHRELCNTCQTLHKIYQISLTTGMVTNLIVIVGFIYYEYIHLFTFYKSKLWFLKNSVGILSMLLLFVGKVIFLNSAIENCCKKAYNTEYMLHALSNYAYDPERQEEISQFSLQTIHMKLRLSAMGLFYFGHNFLCRYFMTITNFAIISIQFNLS